MKRRRRRVGAGETSPPRSPSPPAEKGKAAGGGEVRRLLRSADLILIPFVYPAALILLLIRRLGIANFPRCRRALMTVGVFPIRRHYYEPLFDAREVRAAGVRLLPGIDLQPDVQLDLLGALNPFARELTNLRFDLEGGWIAACDAEYLYCLLRLKKPRMVIEVGGGRSTVLMEEALEKNRGEGHPCEHICIEPYENPWLDRLGVDVIRRRVEETDRSLFSRLAEDDLLFIDSSHVIRPGGDVLFEYLEVLPSLAPGVIVHIHDVFTPYDYPPAWLSEEVRLWNEQYLLEAFLTGNPSWEVIGGLVYLQRGHFEALKTVCPSLTARSEPWSFYIRRRTETGAR